MREITVTENDSGQRADRFLAKLYPKLTISLICKLMRKKRIKLNGVRTEPNVKLAAGDVFCFYLSDELLEQKPTDDDFRNVSNEIEVIYEDENILLVSKPEGMVVHEDDDKTADTLINRIKCYLWKKGEYIPEEEQSFAPALCNRIDRNTCGIVIAAKTAEALRVLNQKIRDRELTKLYLCVTAGTPNPRCATMTAYLQKLEQENRVVVSDRKTPANRTIKTAYRVIDSIGSQSLVEVDLLTGRTHQIRAHFAYVGHALMGDGKYGINKLNKQYGYKTQALCSYKLRFEFTTDAGSLEYLNGREFTLPSLEQIWFVKRYNEIKESGK